MIAIIITVLAFLAGRLFEAFQQQKIHRKNRQVLNDAVSYYRNLLNPPGGIRALSYHEQNPKKENAATGETGAPPSPRERHHVGARD